MLYQASTAFSSAFLTQDSIFLPLKRNSLLGVSMEVPTMTKRIAFSSSAPVISKKTYNVCNCNAANEVHETSSLKKDILPIHGVSELVVGVLGEGQLGRMLCQAASKMGIKISVLDPLENCPASGLSHE